MSNIESELISTVNAPTYQEFRTWALAQGYTPETLAKHVEADDPVKTAERILIHLAGSTFDDQPLPYPKLCALYHGISEPQEAAPLSPYPTLTVADFMRSDVPREHARWLALFEAGWSPAKIAATYDQPLADVERVLDELSMEPLPRRRKVLPTVESDAVALRNAQAWRNRMRRLASHEHWTMAQLHQEFPDYSETMIARIIKAPVQINKTCKHCGAPIQGQRSTREYCNATCRKQASRQSTQKVVSETA